MRIAPAAVLAATIACSAALASESSVTNQAPFDHWKTLGSDSRSVTTPSGSPVVVDIHNTCDAFRLDLVPVPDLDKTAAAVATRKSAGAEKAGPVRIGFEDVFDCMTAPTAQQLRAVYTGLENFRIEVKLEDADRDYVRAIKPDWDNEAFRDDGQPSVQKVLDWFKQTIESCIEVCEDGVVDSLLKIDELDEAAFRKVLQAAGLTGSGKPAEVKFLRPAEFFVYVNESDWRTEFAGAFVVSELVNPQFAVRDGLVMRDKSAEDSQSIALAALVHVSNRKWPGDRWAATFGIGVNSSSDLSLFSGGSWRLGGMGFITLGYNWGKVDRLPNGQALNAAPINGDNTLNGLPKRTDGDWFIAWSYPFLGDARDSLNKPFAPVGE